MRHVLSASLRGCLLCAALVLAQLFPGTATAQETGTVTGTVTRSVEGSALPSVSVTVQGTGQSTITGPDGKYTLRRVPEGPQVIVFRWLGYRPTEAQVSVEAGSTVTADVALEPVAVALTEIVVQGASRAPERIVEAPAAISVVPPEVLQNTSITGQAPLALQTVPGADVVQSGVNDFNVNARGFNSSLNRRVLVLQDGRDLSIAFLGSQEWNGMTQPLEDLGRLEMVRGPGSALYGANAFSGVVNITTPTAREVAGTKLTLAGGELETFRGDFRHAGVFGEDRFGYRINAGYNRSDTYSRSRTLRDGSSLQQEYAPATDEPVPPTIESRPLDGQTADPVTGAPTGDRTPLQNAYGSARLDYYLNNGAVLSADGGGAQVENEVFVTGIGRVQVLKAMKPYARVALAHDRYNIFGFWNSRTSIDPQFSLVSGLPLEERSDIFHIEGQQNWNFQADRGRVVYGASYRNTQVNTSGTLMDPVNDDRSDDYYSAYGQVEYKLLPQLRIVGAGRVDDGTLFETQFSPKGALVFSPDENHSFRFSVNRAFQTPNYSEFFLRVPVAAPTTGPATVEGGIEAYYTGVQGALAGGLLPPGSLTGINLHPTLPWNFSPSGTQALALGNSELEVEKVLGWELGYKGSLSNKLYVTADFYINELENFVTDLLPGVNDAYPTFALTDGGLNIPADLAAIDARLASFGLPTTHPLRAPIPTLQGGYAAVVAGTTIQGGNALATLPDGSRAIVLSYTNFGEVTERGVELGVGYQFTPEIRGDVSFTGFDFEVKSQRPGDQLQPNTPSKKAHFELSYAGSQGFDANVSLRLVDGYQWAAGIFQGYVPASEFLNLSAGYRVNNNLRIHATATNVLDQERFQLYGGSVLRRRVLGGLTANF
ncbi:MAG TPA: TonB-dependent receptor [Gemmatimonadales bacterium]|nr:TonB-dependent receptor [Gemmatimonadales bacterium]